MDVHEFLKGWCEDLGGEERRGEERNGHRHQTT